MVTNSCIVGSRCRGVLVERLIATGGVEGALCIVVERLTATGGVGVACGVGVERLKATGGVEGCLLYTSPSPRD